MSAIVWSFECSLGFPFLGIGMKTDLFQSCGHCWVFQICWHMECSTFPASSFRIWNSSTGIPSSPLALFIVMLSKAHLTSHSRMSGSTWVITPLWLSGLWRSFFVQFPQSLNTPQYSHSSEFSHCRCFNLFYAFYTWNDVVYSIFCLGFICSAWVSEISLF